MDDYQCVIEAQIQVCKNLLVLAICLQFDLISEPCCKFRNRLAKHL